MKDVICWWSGGITSAVACKIAIDLFGKDRCKVIMIDTLNEDIDTYRFLTDCENWYGLDIESLSAISNEKSSMIDIGKKYNSIKDVWRKHKSLNVATGAICSTQLKRRVRESWQKQNNYTHQVFGFEFDSKEFNRAMSLSLNHKKAKPIYPLLMMGYTKEDCINIVSEADITPPRVYSFGFRNNNCFNTGCVQGGIGYWQKMKRDFPDKFYEMAKMEHELTDLRGEPVTMLKDQSNYAKEIVKTTGLKWKQRVFLVKHNKYPELKCIDDMDAQPVKPIFECNGFCGVNELDEVNPTAQEINFMEEEPTEQLTFDL